MHAVQLKWKEELQQGVLRSQALPLYTKVFYEAFVWKMCTKRWFLNQSFRLIYNNWQGKVENYVALVFRQVRKQRCEISFRSSSMFFWLLGNFDMSALLFLSHVIFTFSFYLSTISITWLIISLISHLSLFYSYISLNEKVERCEGNIFHYKVQHHF